MILRGKSCSAAIYNHPAHLYSPVVGIFEHFSLFSSFCFRVTISCMATKPPKDMNQLGHFLVAQATGQLSDAPTKTKSSVKVLAGAKGGAKGGDARAASLTASKRSEIAKKAAKKRWDKK